MSFGGYWGKILRVNLTTKEVSVQEFDEAFARKWLGGVGFAAKICYDEIPAGADPLGPENLLVYACGPYQGYTAIQGSGRFAICGKSPLTGIWGQSTGGGHQMSHRPPLTRTPEGVRHRRTSPVSRVAAS